MRQKRRVGCLKKNHAGGCQNSGRLADCDCAWKGRYRHREVTFATWLAEKVDPRNEREAERALARLVTAVEDGTFDKRLRPAKAGAATLAVFIDHEYLPNHVERHGHSSNSIRAMLGVIAGGELGRLTLPELAGDAQRIERWLDREGRAREWKAATWNDYHGLLFTLFEKALTWKVKGKVRIAANPIREIETRRAAKPEHFKVRLEEPVEDRLFAAVEALNGVRRSTRGRLTQEAADEIRARVAAGETQKAVAAAFEISSGLCCQIIKGEIWNPATYRVGTKGTEMRRRLIGAFDGGMRLSEMMLTQIKHVHWTPVRLTAEIEAYEINLPPEITKGGKSSGKPETIYAATPRFRKMLEDRRFQLRRRNAAGRMEPDPDGYIFGREDGSYQRDFDRMWRKLFTAAGIAWGRDRGMVWHSIRHEFISRVAELTHGDAVLTQAMARHQSYETTTLYLKVRQRRLLEVAAGLSRP